MVLPVIQEVWYVETPPSLPRARFCEPFGLSRWLFAIGKVVSLQIPGKTVIVLNSAKAAVDLLDKRSANYSDRPITTMMLLYVKSFLLIIF